MDREQMARAAVAAGLFVLALAAVFSLWFVLPATRGGQVAMAQEEVGPIDMEGPPGMEAIGDMPGAPAAPDAPPAAPPGPPAPPLEPSRANPFVPLDIPEPEVKYVSSATRYGPDWTNVPLGYFTALPQPEIPPAPPPPLPPSPSATADMIRINAIVWPQQDVGVGAPGRAFATWEDPDGRTRLAVPGSQIGVSMLDAAGQPRDETWRVVTIEPETVVLRNTRTGETSRVRAQPRTRAEQRHWGARRMADELREAEAEGRVVPGRGAVLPQGAADIAPTATPGVGPEGAAPGEMGMPMGMPGFPGMP